MRIQNTFLCFFHFVIDMYVLIFLRQSYSKSFSGRLFTSSWFHSFLGILQLICDAGTKLWKLFKTAESFHLN